MSESQVSSNPESASDLPWHGWIRRPGCAWVRVCDGDSYPAVWDKLLAGDYGKHSDRLVLPAGQTPATRPARPRRFL
jgi:hypothetical protein